MRPELPAGWQWVPLSRLVSKIEAGKSFKCDERPPRDGEPGIVKVSAVTWGTYDEQESKTIMDAERVNDAYLIRPGDFLFSRANTLQLVGACVLVSATRKHLLLSDKILRLVMPDALKPWLLWFLRSAEGRRQIEGLSTGNQESMRNIGQERIGQIEVPLPAEGTMERIVSRIEKLFSEIDEGERAGARGPAGGALPPVRPQGRGHGGVDAGVAKQERAIFGLCRVEPVRYPSGEKRSSRRSSTSCRSRRLAGVAVGVGMGISGRRRRCGGWHHGRPKEVGRRL